MSSNRLPRLRRLTGAGVLVLLLAASASQGAPPAKAGVPAEPAARSAEQVRAAELLQVRELERRLAATTEPRVRAECYEQLLDLYARLGQLDRAVRAGLRARALLRGGRLAGRATAGRLRTLDLRLGECHRALGHYHTAEGYLRGALADTPGLPPLPPVRRVEGLTELAQCAEKLGDRTEAARRWLRVEGAAVAALDRRRPALGAEEQIACVRRLTDAYRFRAESGKAIARLKPLLPLHDRQGDRAGKADTLRRLAGFHAALGHDAEAETCLRQALDLADGKTAVQRIARGDLADELAETLTRRKRPLDEVAKWRRRAAEDYRAALAPPKKSASSDIAPVLTAFWRLQKLYQKTSQYRSALRLVETQSRAWADPALDDPRLRSEQGTLEIILGSFAPARGLLRAAVRDLEAQTPPNLIDLPRALNNLAVVEEATGDPDRADALATRCLALYRKHGLPDDLLVVEAYNVRGTCAAARGEYAEAVDRFRDGLARCDKLGPRAYVQRGSLLLNIALLHKSQGDTAEALRALEEALAAYKRYADPGALGFAAFDAARAGLYAAQRRLSEAYDLTPGILARCRKYGIDKGPLLVTARHCEGLYRLSRGECAAAERAWRQVLALQEEQKSAPLLPRTLNYLGLSGEMQGRHEEATALYKRADRLQRNNPRAFPVTRFISLWRLAGLADRAGRRAEARRLLEEALGVVEKARQGTYGEARERAAYFAQFAPGFEQLVEYCIRDGDVAGAFAATARGRSRTLLDQLRLSGVDPRAGLKGARQEELRRQEAALRRRINGLRARAQLIPLTDATAPRAKKLLAELDEAEGRYAVVWREILNASPAYRGLAADDPSRGLLDTLRDKVLGPRTLLLVYHIGRQRSHLLLLGGRGVKPEAFALVVPAGVAGRLAALEPMTVAKALGTKRGIVLVPARRQPPAPPPPAAAEAGATVPLGHDVARALVDHYGRQIANPNFRPSRGIVLVPRVATRPVPEQSAALLGNVLLPAAVRRRIREEKAECVVVIPDGPLHQLPLEALLLEAGAKPRYVLDELPPLVYAPSAAALAVLAGRPRPTGPRSLLTVSNPAYPELKEEAKLDPHAAAPAPVGLAGLRGQLPRLPGTARESKRIRASFDPARVTVLEGERATERAVREAVAGKRVFHLAAHGIADDRLGNLFGALALTPPPPDKESAEEDGFLSLHEIYALPLKDCELAVLSACLTNVGPRRPLEAGVTLAGGFLAAGARRVIASHWSVDDESTAELMAKFFRAAAADHGPAPYARALWEARRKVRNTPKWSAPYHWAPFVLIGPPR